MVTDEEMNGMDDEDMSFPDEDEEDIAVDSDSLSVTEGSGKGSFMDDPWPPVAFFLIIIGLLLTTLTPADVWSQHVYYLAATYLLVVFVAISSVISLGVYRNTATRLRYGGVTTFIVDIVCGIFGIIDTFLVVFTGTPLLLGATTPVLAIAFVIVVFTLYTLWLIQRTYATEASVD